MTKESKHMITVYQINLTNADYHRVNEVGHEAAANEIPAYRAHLDCSFRGSKGFNPEFFQCYKAVAQMDCADLEDAFEIGNIGPERKITRLAPMHSVSVGDILEQNGQFFMVDSFGFEQVVTA